MLQSDIRALGFTKFQSLKLPQAFEVFQSNVRDPSVFEIRLPKRQSS